MNVTRMRAATLADRLGKVKGEISELQKLEKELKAEILERELEEVIGKDFRILVSDCTRDRVDYAELYEAFEISPEDIEPYTTVVEYPRITVTRV